MYDKIQSQAGFETLITLEEAKAQCNLLSSQTFDDDFIEGLILSCCDIAQAYTKRMLTVGSVTLRADCEGNVISLPWGEPATITELIADDVDITAETSLYDFDDITEKLTMLTSYTRLKVTYDAGYTALPLKVKQAILMMISTMYEQRSDFVAGMTVANIPVTSTILLDSVKYYAS